MPVGEQENPYAAPQATLRPPVPLTVYARAAIVGTAAFIFSFALAVGFSTILWIGGTTWIGPAIPDRIQTVRYGLLVCCTALGMLGFIHFAPRELRRQKQRIRNEPCTARG
jgi:hypothetical protein